MPGPVSNLFETDTMCPLRSPRCTTQLGPGPRGPYGKCATRGEAWWSPHFGLIDGSCQPPWPVADINSSDHLWGVKSWQVKNSILRIGFVELEPPKTWISIVDLEMCIPLAQLGKWCFSPYVIDMIHFISWVRIMGHNWMGYGLFTHWTTAVVPPGLLGRSGWT